MKYNFGNILKKSSTYFVSTLAIISFLIVPLPVFASSYQQRDLGTVTGISSYSLSMNDSDVVAGVTVDGKGGGNLVSCFIKSHNGFEVFNGLAGGLTSDCYASSINNKNQVMGMNTNFDAKGVSRGFLWQDGVAVDFLNLPYGYSSTPRAINNNEQIVGEYTVPTDPGCTNCGGIPRGFVWKNGVTTQLPCQALAVDNNDLDQVVADNESNCNPGSQWHRGIIWQNGNITNLDFIPRAINNKGHVIGTDPSTNQSLLWINGNITYLENTFFAQDINDSDQISGFIGTTSGDESAAVWDKGTITLLGQDQKRSEALSVNNIGDIVGISVVNAIHGLGHVVIWSPIH